MGSARSANLHARDPRSILEAIGEDIVEDALPTDMPL
jgi:hypothetical protein